MAIVVISCYTINIIIILISIEYIISKWLACQHLFLFWHDRQLLPTVRKHGETTCAESTVLNAVTVYRLRRCVSLGSAVVTQ